MSDRLPTSRRPTLRIATGWPVAVAVLILGGCAGIPDDGRETQAVAAALEAIGEQSPRHPPFDMTATLSCGAAFAPDSVGAPLEGEYGSQLCVFDRMGPNAVIAWAGDARGLRWQSSQGMTGLPVLLKDNIETHDMPTTAGSLALAANAPGRDAPLVTRLRQAGAVILGKTNLSEWANIRSSNSISGWSAVGGLTRNPHALDRNACGSSSGSAAAVAAGLAPAAIGTETDGSITCPAAINGIVGFKPTVGLVSRTHIVPISHSQDTAGPMTRTVADAALVLTAIAGSDPADPATEEADARKTDYREALDDGSLRGARLGVLRFGMGYSTATDAVFEQNLQVLRDAGAILIDITERPSDAEAMGNAEFAVLLTELKVDLNAYLASTDPIQVPTRTLADVIAFNQASPRELALFGQELFLQAEQTMGLDDPAYIQALATSRRLAGPEGIDKLLADHDVLALIAPTTGPAWTTDVVNGDNYGGSVSSMPAIAGYPHLTVPMGFVRGLPVGISFIGTQWDDARILSLGHAYEQRTMALRPPTFARSVDAMDATERLLARPK